MAVVQLAEVDTQMTEHIGRDKKCRDDGHSPFASGDELAPCKVLNLAEALDVETVVWGLCVLLGVLPLRAEEISASIQGILAEKLWTGVFQSLVCIRVT